MREQAIIPNDFETSIEDIKTMYKKGKIKTHQLTLETLTPIHIGTGEQLKINYDYIVKNKKPFVVDKAAIYDIIIEQGKHNDNRLHENDFNVQTLVDISGQECGYSLKPIAGFKYKPINECIKNAYLKPYIPGSSLKGAIRTAIVSDILNNNEHTYKQLFLTNNKNKSIDDQPLMKALFGSNPHKDIFRAFKVSDVIFPVSPEPVLAEVMVENIYKGCIQTLYVEAINKQQSGHFFMSWDEFLLNNSEKWNDSTVNCNTFLSTYTDFCKRINTSSIRYLKNEMDFYQAMIEEERKKNCVHQIKLYEIIVFLNDLFKKIQSDIQNNASKAYLQMSWGAGWRNKTGNWLNHYLEKIRDSYNLGKGKGVFPRTRRLLYNNCHAEIPGWICISTEPIVIKQKKKSCSWVDQTIEKLCATKNTKPDDMLKSKLLAEEWDTISEKELQQQALDEIKRRWKEKGWMDGKPKGAIKKAIQIYGIIWDEDKK